MEDNGRVDTRFMEFCCFSKSTLALHPHCKDSLYNQDNIDIKSYFFKDLVTEKSTDDPEKAFDLAAPQKIAAEYTKAYENIKVNKTQGLQFHPVF